MRRYYKIWHVIFICKNKISFFLHNTRYMHIHTHDPVLSYSHFLLLSHLPDVTGVVPVRNNSHKSPMVTQIHFVRFHWRRCFNKTRRGPIIQLGDLSLHSRMIRVHVNTHALKTLYFYHAKKRIVVSRYFAFYSKGPIRSFITFISIARSSRWYFRIFSIKNDWQAVWYIAVSFPFAEAADYVTPVICTRITIRR